MKINEIPQNYSLDKFYYKFQIDVNLSFYIST